MRINIADVELSRTPGAPAGLSPRAHLFTVGAQLTHTVVYELDPGEAVCPFHYELGHELWALVHTGRPTMRTTGGWEQLETGDIVFAPIGPDGAHQFFNPTDDIVRLVGWSNGGRVGASIYPDSDKIGVWPTIPGHDFVAERRSEVGYFEGETGPINHESQDS